MGEGRELRALAFGGLSGACTLDALADKSPDAAFLRGGAIAM